MRIAAVATVAAVAAAALAACGPSKPPTEPNYSRDEYGPPRPPDDVAPVTDPAPGLRLADQLTVIDYKLELEIDPNQPQFDGAVAIAAKLPAARRSIVLHADRLTIKTATATPAGGAAVALTPRDLGGGRMAFDAAAALPAGELSIAIAYRGVLDETDTLGAFRQQTGGQWYAFSQLEPISARRAFPCVDEPGVKVPFTVAITVPQGMTAVSNTKEASDVAVPARAVHRIAFETTPPLPTYLVAFGVGAFDFVDAGTSKSGRPLRIVVPAGRAADAAIAAELTPKIASWLEDWFGMPLPYGKLDALAIPITVNFGAMENVGLITYRADLLLMQGDVPAFRRARYAAIAAHEIAHQWFGDLVTPAWWDDIWLNESFATWMSQKTMESLFPEYVEPATEVDRRGGSLGADSLGTARRIRQPIATEDDIITAFDGISYGKGAAVLRMFEGWAGVEKWQQGVRDYLKAHAHGNATAADFLAAVTKATGADVTATMSTFLDQAGAPRIDATMTCEAGRGTITITQSRYLPLGADRPGQESGPAGHSSGGSGSAVAGKPAADPVWKLPVCVVFGAPGVKAGAKGARHEVCTLVEAPTATIETDGCAPGGWIYANAGGRGYYRSAVAGTRAVMMKDGWRHLTGAERLAFAQDLGAGIAAGEAEVTAKLDLVPALVADGGTFTLFEATETIDGLRRFLPAKDKAVARWVRAKFGKTAAALGWKPKPSDGLLTDARREHVVTLVADLGADPALTKQAVALAPSWRSFPADGARGKLLRVALRADHKLADKLRAEFIATSDRLEHGDLAVALGAIDDRAELEKSLALLLDPKVDIRASGIILRHAVADPLTRGWAEAWTIAHLDELIARYPGEGAAKLVGALVQSCDADKIAPMRAIADAKIVPLAGGKRWTDQAFEGFAQCVEQRKAIEPALATWRKSLE
jgi:alanyl aminopeptidase